MTVKKIIVGSLNPTFNADEGRWCKLYSIRSADDSAYTICDHMYDFFL